MDTSNREVVTDLARLHELLPTWYGQDFAIDLETTGLNYRQDRILGIALAFADGRIFYVVCEHTVPQVATVVETIVEQVPTGESEDYVHLTPSGRERIKQRPVYKEVSRQEERDATTYPTVEFCPREVTLALLRPLLAQDNVMVAHNLKYELHMLSNAAVAMTGRLADTMLAAQLIDENVESKSLKYLSQFVDMALTPYQKLDRYPGFGKDEILAVPLDLAASYAMDDVEATWKLWEKYRVELTEEGVDAAFRDIWMPLLPVLQQMEAAGIALDIEKVQAVRDDYVARAAEHEDRVWREGIEMVTTWLTESGFEETGVWEDVLPATYLTRADQFAEITETTTHIKVRGVILPVLRKERKAYQPRVPHFNVGSNAHLKDLLYKHHRLEVPTTVRLKRNQDGSIGVDRDTLVTLRLSLPNPPPVIDEILAWRKTQKFVGTYLDKMLEIADPTDHYAIRSSFNQAVTDTGRLSSSQPINFQNIPSRGEVGQAARSMFVARPGHKLVVCDYGTMELRVAAHYSQDEKLLYAFEQGLDLHALGAADAMGIPYEEFMQRLGEGDADCKAARNLNKVFNFSLVYGMGPQTLKRRLYVDNGVDVDIAEAKQMIADFDAYYEGLTEWKKRVTRYAKQLGYVLSIKRRKRRLPHLYSEERYEVMGAERQATNYVIQGTCADIMCEVMPPIQQALKPLGGQILLTVHDEIVAEVREDMAPLAARIVESIMVGIPNTYLRCPLVAEAGIGDTWGDAK